MGLDAKQILLAGFLLVPAVAAGGEVYSYVDADGVVHFTNAPSDRRYRKVTRTSDVAGVYRPPPRPAGGAPAARSQNGYDPHIKTAAEKYRIPVELLRAVMAVESNYDARAVSEKGAVGLMQLMPRTAQDM